MGGSAKSKQQPQTLTDVVTSTVTDTTTEVGDITVGLTGADFRAALGAVAELGIMQTAAIRESFDRQSQNVADFLRTASGTSGGDGEIDPALRTGALWAVGALGVFLLLWGLRRG